MTLDDFLSVSDINHYKKESIIVRAFNPNYKESEPTRKEIIKKFLAKTCLGKLTEQEQIEKEVFEIYENWYYEYSSSTNPQKKRTNKKIAHKLAKRFCSEYVAVSYLGGNITTPRSKVFYVGFGSGLWAYSCASLTHRETMAVDPSDAAYNSAQKVLMRFGPIDILKFEKKKLEEVTNDVREGDTLLTVHCGDGLYELKKEMVDLAKSKNANCLFSVQYSCCIFSDTRPPNEQIEEKLTKLGIDSADVACSRECGAIAYVLIKAR